MGLTLTVTTPRPLTWPALRDVLAATGRLVQMRMIDGELAFPDEEPPDEWQEIRLGLVPGMVTVRREPGRVLAIVWGNADEALREAWHAVAQAAADATGGTVADDEPAR